MLPGAQTPAEPGLPVPDGSSPCSSRQGDGGPSPPHSLGPVLPVSKPPTVLPAWVLISLMWTTWVDCCVGRSQTLIRQQAGAPEALTDHWPDGRVDTGLSPRRLEAGPCAWAGVRGPGPGDERPESHWAAGRLDHRAAVVTSPERRPFGVQRKKLAYVWARVLGARGGHGQWPPRLLCSFSVAGPAEKQMTTC